MPTKAAVFLINYEFQNFAQIFKSGYMNYSFCSSQPNICVIKITSTVFY